jgi:hypothetical protein
MSICMHLVVNVEWWRDCVDASACLLFQGYLVLQKHEGTYICMPVHIPRFKPFSLCMYVGVYTHIRLVICVCIPRISTSGRITV